MAARGPIIKRWKENICQASAACFRRITGRRQMAKTLRESEEKYRSLFEYAWDAVILADTKTGIIEDVNEAAMSMLGYPREKIIGMHYSILHPPEKTEEYIRLFQEHIKKGMTFSEDIILQSADGKQIQCNVSTSIINLPGRSIIQVVFRDVTERDKLIKRLKESEEKFSKAFKVIPDAISISRLKDGMILDTNDTFLRTRGFNREDIIGRTVYDLNLWDRSGGRERMIQMIKNRGGIFHEERELPVIDGKSRTILFSANIIEIGSEPYMITIANDISEMKQTEKALRESEEKFSKIFRLSPSQMVITRQKDGKTMDVNDSYTRITGYSREESIGRTSIETGIWVNPEDRDRMAQKLRETGRVYNEEYRFRIKSGEVRDSLFSAGPITINDEPCIVAIITDITEQKQMENALKDSEEKFSRAFNAFPDAVAITSLANGVYLEVNERFLTLNGYTREEVIGHTSKELNIWTNPKDRYRIKQLMEKQGRFENEEFILRRKSGELRTVLLAAEIINYSGQPYLLTIGNDITVKKQAEEKLKETMTELELSSTRLEATNKELESFSYSVSHDLRSPLRSIDGFSQALLEDYGPKLDETAQDYLQRLRTASQRMGELIDGLLKLSRLSRNEIHNETVDLSAVAQEISARLKETDPDRKAEFIIDAGLSADGDPQMLRVLLENLLGNAWKFTRKVPQARIEFGTADNGQKKTFFIKDNGAGFDMSYTDKLFGAFQRLHSAADFPGTGIGLATVQRIINRHGGNIRAEGAVGKGASFYFTLP